MIATTATGVVTASTATGVCSRTITGTATCVGTITGMGTGTTAIGWSG